MKETQTPQLVLIDMTFPTMVWFMVKMAIAAIPAFLILAAIGMVVMGVLGVVVQDVTL